MTAAENMECVDWQNAHEYPWIEALSNWEFRDAFLCPFQTTIGGPEFATMILGAIGMAYMIRQGSLGIATVVMIITGGIFVGQVAGIVLGIITMVVLTMFGIVPVLVIRRMSRG